MSNEREPRRPNSTVTTGTSEKGSHARHTTSINLSAMAAGSALIGFSILAFDDQATRWVHYFTVPVVFLFLCSIIAYRSAPTDPERRILGYRIVAVVAAAMLLFGALPLGNSIGALTLLGVGFFVVGLYEHSAPVWITACICCALGLIVANETFRSLFGIEVTNSSQNLAGIAILIFAVAVAAYGFWHRNMEKQSTTC